MSNLCDAFLFVRRFAQRKPHYANAAHQLQLSADASHREANNKPLSNLFNLAKIGTVITPTTFATNRQTMQQSLWDESSVNDVV